LTNRTCVKVTLAAGIAVASLGGFLLHYRIHPPANNAANYIPFVTGLISAVLIPALLLIQRTIHWGYVLNGMIVIIGSITMAHYSLVKLPAKLTMKAVFLNTTLADILILWGVFAMGKALFDLHFFDPASEKPKGRWFRYPNTGWWLAHLVGLSLVYYLGRVLWR
jgi:hypothetical protein